MKKKLINLTKRILSVIMATMFMFAFSSVALGQGMEAENHRYIHVWGDIYMSTAQKYIWNQLLADVALINSIAEAQEESFVLENRAWLNDVNMRLENFMNDFSPQDQQNLSILLAGVNPLMRNSLMSAHFNSWQRHWRGNFLTYTLRPNLATRSLMSQAIAGWVALDTTFEFTWNYGNHTTRSLHDQYFCHFDFDFETFFFFGTWDLEVGRPNVGPLETRRAFCNP